MLKLALLALAASVLCRVTLGQWPWAYLSTQRNTRGQALFQARKLLGIEAHANRAEILAAHKRLVAMVHPDRGGTNAQVYEANAARDLLLDELPDEGAPPA